jgi:Na+-driven multidrug efflux pump
VLARLATVRECYRLELKKLRFDWIVFKNMMRIGIPSGIQGSMYSISNALLMTGVNSLGTVVVASWSMSGKIDGIYWATSNAFGVALMNFVAQNYGAGRIDRVKSSVGLGLKLFGGISIFLSVAIMAVAKLILPVFTNDPAVIETTYEVLLYFVPPYILWTCVEVFSSVLKGAGDAMAPAIIQLFGVCLLRVVWVYTIFRIWPTLFAIAMCYPASWIVTDIAMFIRYRSGKWNKHQLTEGEAA